ncbi:MAG TPA: hypothetical protein VGE40_11860 [Bacilli bacterium]
MNCYFHHDKESNIICKICKRVICPECTESISDKDLGLCYSCAFDPVHGVKTIEKKAMDSKEVIDERSGNFEKSKLVGIFIIIGLIVLFLVFNAWWILLGLNGLFKNIFSQPEKYGEEAAIYLKERYNKEFIVTDVEYLSVPDFYRMKAYPKTEKQPIFDVVALEKKIKPEYRDDYLKYIWDKQLKELLMPTLQNLFPTENYYFEIEHDFPHIFTEAVFDVEVRSLDEMINKYPNKIYISFRLAGFIDEDEAYKLEEYSRLYEFASYFIDRQIERVSVNFIYIDKNSDKNLILNELKEEGFGSFDQKYSGILIKNECYINNLSDIQSVEDIVRDCNEHD